MRLRFGWMMVVVVACSGGSAGTAPDGAVVDGAEPDAPAQDACPHRTAAAGQPQTPPSPAEVRAGDVIIRNALDVTALAGVKVITGSVVIGSTELTAVALPDLEVIAGGLTVMPGSVETVALPRLETVGGGIATVHVAAYRLPRLETVGRFMLLNAAELAVGCLRGSEGTDPADRAVRLFGHAGAALALPALERGDLELGEMTNLVAIELPRYPAGSLTLGDNPALTSISAPLYTGGDAISIAGSPLLATVALPALRTAPAISLVQLGLTSLAWLAPATLDAVEVAHLDQLTTLDGLPASLRALRVVDNARLVDVDVLAAETALRWLHILGNPLLATVELPALAGIDADLRVENNAVLTRLVAPQLTAVGTSIDDHSRIRDNPALSNACATAIRDRVLAATPAAEFAVSGNGGPATCP